MKHHRSALCVAVLLLAAAGCKEKELPSPKPVAPPSVVPAMPKAEVVIEGVPAEDQPALKKLLRVDGVMRRGSEYVVALNGQVVKRGEFLRFTVKKKNYVLEVLNISSQSILLKATAQGNDNTSTRPSPIPKAAQ